MPLNIITTVFSPATAQSPADPYDLTTLANAHLEIKVPSTDETNDAWLSRAITQASRSIRTYCNRIFQIEGLTDLIYVRRDAVPYQEPAGPAPLLLSRHPVAQVVTIETASDTPSGNVIPLENPPPAWAVEGTPVSALNIPSGTTIASTNGNDITLSAAVLGDVPEGTPITLGFSVFQTYRDGTQNPLVFGTDYTIDLTADLNPAELYRLDIFGRLGTWEALPVSVSYYAGYSEIPPDLEDAALRLITMRYFGWGRDPALKAQEQPGSLGRREWWIGGPPKSGGLPEEVTGLIDRYRTPIAL